LEVLKLNVTLYLSINPQGYILLADQSSWVYSEILRLLKGNLIGTVILCYPV